MLHYDKFSYLPYLADNLYAVIRVRGYHHAFLFSIISLGFHNVQILLNMLYSDKI